MKLLENSYIVEDKVVPNPNSFMKQEWLDNHEGNYYCKHCGWPDSATADYSEMSYGTALVVNMEGDLDDYDTGDHENFEVHNYRCRECEIEVHRLADLVTDSPDEGWEAYKRANNIVEETMITDFEDEE